MTGCGYSHTELARESFWIVLRKDERVRQGKIHDLSNVLKIGPFSK